MPETWRVLHDECVELYAAAAAAAANDSVNGQHPPGEIRRLQGNSQNEEKIALANGTAGIG